jgi:hypothetical protein
LDFQISIEIAASQDVVWGVMSDVERWHEWTASVRSVRRLDTGPLRVGSRAVIRQPKFPPALWTVTAIDPGRSFTWRSGAPGMWVHGHHSIEAIAGGARATLRLHFQGVLGRLLGTMTSAINNRYLGMEAAGLKRRSEALRS